MKKEPQTWDKRWKPELALIQKKEMDRYEKNKSVILQKTIFDGKSVYATNGHIMAVFPSNKRMGRRFDPKSVNVKKAIPTRDKKYRIAFNPVYLMRLLKAMGHNHQDRVGCIFEVDPKNNHSVIRVELTALASNKAFGLLMPMRNSGEDCQLG